MFTCRTCTAISITSETLHVMFGTDVQPLLQLLADSTALSFAPDDELPKHICSGCLAKLEKLQAFCAQVIEADLLHRSKMIVKIKIKMEEQSTADSNRNDHTDDNNSRNHDVGEDDINIKEESCSAYDNNSPFTKQLMRVDRHRDDGNSNQQDAGDENINHVNSDSTHQPPADVFHPSHQPPPPYTCDLCGRCDFRAKHLLAGHLRAEHCGLRPFACPHCPWQFDKYFQLTHHQRTHEPDRRTVCAHPGCGKTYRKPHLAQDHYDRIHLRAARGSEALSVCEQCGRAFKSRLELQSHMRTHWDSSEAPFGCEECGKRFWAKQAYEKHQLRHRGIKEWACPQCPARAVSEWELKRHVAGHDRSGQWPCPECAKVFNRKPTLLQHQNHVHRNKRQHVCSFCQRGFNTSTDLRIHERRHTGERPYACTQCEKAFVKLSLLNKHLKTLHAN